ncbi:MAG: CTP synthase [Puniceicoccales bacterium]|jgi:CTP synthase|nr:CTP synthase [Puniceicoccales bacterium]
MRHIFITGGVVSSLGKGLTAAALGALLECRGLRVTLQKLDPYLNVDPGTMSPFQHGEVYVLDDGAETDLDLGHYERFTHAKLGRGNSVSAGQIYETVLLRERRGDFLGQTVQVIPHVTDEIRARLHVDDGVADVAIVELGGTVGDMEGMPFLEALRQFALDVGRSNVLFGHVTLLPYLRMADEVKTKPAQQSVATLRTLGIQPDILFCRTERHLSDEVRKKLSLFCNVPAPGVVQELDVTSIYAVPAMLHDEGVDRFILDHFGLPATPCDLSPWAKVREMERRRRHPLTIALVGKYVDLQDAYKSVYEALEHGALACSCRLDVVRVDSEIVDEGNVMGMLKDCSGVLVPGGFGNRGILGKMCAIRHARENGIPYLGICLGMQLAVVEFARNRAGLAGAHSTEFDPATPHPVVEPMEEQKRVSNMGGSMRLGSYPCHVARHSLLSRVYGGQERVDERHRHRYEFNGHYRTALEDCGMAISGVHPGGLVEAVEVVAHPWFVGVQFHPEFRSKPHGPHPLFREFIAASLRHCQ